MTDAPDHRAEVLRGITLMCIGALVLPFLNMLAKYLSGHYPVAQIVWARYAGHLLYMLILFAPRRGLSLFATSRPGVHMLRSALLLGSTLLYFTAIGFVDLPVAAAVGFTGPLFVTLLAVPMLGEQVGIRRWSAVLVGFAGAVIIVRPGGGAIHPAVLLVVGTALCYAIYQILTRRVGSLDNAVTSLIYTSLVGTAVMTVALPFVWRTPDNLLDLGAFLGMGAFASIGHYFVVRAFQHAPASVVTPFNYAQLLGAVGLGFVVFGTLPDLWTWVGAGLIVSSGIYVTYRETLRRRAEIPPLKR